MSPYCWLVYDHDLEEVADLGWEEFIVRQWESIFVGYRGWTGLRSIGRRWSDLIEIGLGCSQNVADWLVATHIIHGPDRGLQAAPDGVHVVSGMIEVLADLRPDLAEIEDETAEFWLLDRHARLLSLIRVHAFGQEDEPPPPS
jgi:hypothetical protein